MKAGTILSTGAAGLIATLFPAPAEPLEKMGELVAKILKASTGDAMIAIDVHARTIAVYDDSNDVRLGADSHNGENLVVELTPVDPIATSTEYNVRLIVNELGQEVDVPYDFGVVPAEGPEIGGNGGVCVMLQSPERPVYSGPGIVNALIDGMEQGEPVLIFISQNRKSIRVASRRTSGVTAIPLVSVSLNGVAPVATFVHTPQEGPSAPATPRSLFGI